MYAQVPNPHTFSTQQPQNQQMTSAHSAPPLLSHNFSVPPPPPGTAPQVLYQGAQPQVIYLTAPAPAASGAAKQPQKGGQRRQAPYVDRRPNMDRRPNNNRNNPSRNPIVKEVRAPHPPKPSKPQNDAEKGKRGGLYSFKFFVSCPEEGTSAAPTLRELTTQLLGAVMEMKKLLEERLPIPLMEEDECSDPAEVPLNSNDPLGLNNLE